MYIHIKTYPDSKREEVTEKSKDHFEVYLREKAERNMANKRLIEIMMERFSLAKGKVRIISGHHSPSKILSIDIG